MKTLGFNSIRLTFSNQMLLPSSVTNGIDLALNPDMNGLSPLSCMDLIVAYCGQIGLRVMLNRYVAIIDNFDNEELWYIPNNALYNEAAMISDWVALARRYSNTAVFGMDLWSEPRGLSTWGAGLATDWNQAAARIGNAILEANPDLLIIVEGVSGYYWRGGHLEGVEYNPVVLNVPNKVVYSIHEYSCDLEQQTWFTDENYPNNLFGLWDLHFGYIMRERIAPVLIGEFGYSLANACDETWLPLWMNYTSGQYVTSGVSSLLPGEKGMSWMFRGVDPFPPLGGILTTDWQTVETIKMNDLKPHLAPLLPTYDPMPTQRPTATFVPSFTPRPTISIPPTVRPTSSFPSVSPTLPLFGYYYANGSQIVNGRGKAVRFSGLNW
jgi:hypothetical protein